MRVCRDGTEDTDGVVGSGSDNGEQFTVCYHWRPRKSRQCGDTSRRLTETTVLLATYRSVVRSTLHSQTFTKLHDMCITTIYHHFHWLIYRMRSFTEKVRFIVLSHWPHVATHVATQVAAHVASVKGLGHKSLNLLPSPFMCGDKSACSGDLWRMELTCTRKCVGNLCGNMWLVWKHYYPGDHVTYTVVVIGLRT